LSSATDLDSDITNTFNRSDSTGRVLTQANHKFHVGLHSLKQQPPLLFKAFQINALGSP